MTGGEIDWTGALEALGGLATAVSAALILWQIRENRRWSRLQASHQILNDFVSGALDDALESLEKRFGWDLLRTPERYEAVAARLGDDPEGRAALDRQLRRLLRRFEAMFVSVDNGIVNETVCHAYFFNIVGRLYDQAQEFIEEERLRRGEDRVFQHVEKYARRWATRARR